MTAAPAITKTSYAKDSYYVDFVNQLGTGETIALGSVTAFDPTNGLDLSSELIAASPAPAVSGTQVIFWYQGGVAGNTYTISVKVTTSAGRSLEGDVDMQVVADLETT